MAGLMGGDLLSVAVEIGSGTREWSGPEWFPPGPQLAVCLAGRNERLADLSDDGLLQVAAAARRQTSWAQARELAAIAELARRREDAETAGESDYRILSAYESTIEEVAAALTVTSNTAATLVHIAGRLTGPLAATGEALETGQIDLAKARVICDAPKPFPTTCRTARSRHPRYGPDPDHRPTAPPDQAHRPPVGPRNDRGTRA